MITCRVQINKIKLVQHEGVSTIFKVFIRLNKKELQTWNPACKNSLFYMRLLKLFPGHLLFASFNPKFWNRKYLCNVICKSWVTTPTVNISKSSTCKAHKIPNMNRVIFSPVYFCHRNLVRLCSAKAPAAAQRH